MGETARVESRLAGRKDAGGKVPWGTVQSEEGSFLGDERRKNMGRILVAEDDAFMLRILSMWLSRNGHTVSEASNGIAAQASLMDGRHGGFDFIVSDINMPGLNGIALAEWLRKEMRSSTPMILLSSRCDQTRITEQVKPLGVGVHAKPFSPARLVAEIERRLEAANQGVSPGTG